MKFALTFLCAAMSLTAQLRVVNLRCEYRVNPWGIDVAAPRMSWEILAATPAARDVRQGAYQVLAATSAEMLTAGRGDLWGLRQGGERPLHPRPCTQGRN